MERKLAHIEQIAWIKPIEGADNIEKVGVLGWVLIARNGEFKVGDKCCFFEIDSKLPEEDWSAFMAAKHYKVKTMKLGKFEKDRGGVISQGLALPITSIPKLADKEWNIGDDVTDLLGVKYSVAEDNIRKAKSNPDAKYNAMASRHPKLAKKKWFRWLMKRTWGKKLLYFFFGRKKDNEHGFPTKFEFVHKTDETRCLVAGTKIETNYGKIRISEIVNKQKDVLVKSINNNNNEIEYKPILQFQKFDPEETIYIRYKKGINSNPTNHSSGAANSIVCSKDHRLFTRNGYKNAKDITLDDQFMMSFITYNDDGISALYGMLLGDSYLAIDKRLGDCSTCRVAFTQGEQQLDYLKEKVRLLDIKANIRQEKSGYTDHKVYTVYTPVDEHLTQSLMEDGSIVDRKIYITENFCKRLNAISLAFWYLDDGCIRHNNDDIFNPSIEFSTYAYDINEIELLCKTLGRYELTPTIYDGKKNGKYIGSTIKLNVKDTDKFLGIISPYIPYCMRYKTTDKYKNVEYLLANTIYARTEQILPVPIIEIKSYRKLPLYDIEVADNHNFIANDIVNHNCEALDQESLFKNKEPLIQTTKCDGTSGTFILERLKNKKYEYYVCSRNVRQLTPDQATYHDDNVYWNAEFKFHIKDFLQKMLELHPEWNYVAIQGEICGPNIQGNPHKLTDLRFLAFNFIDSVDGRWNSINGKILCEQHGIEWVPIVNEEYYLPDDMETLKLQADGECEIPGSSGLREGYVYRSYDGVRSFKNVSRQYLLKHDG